MKHGKVEQIGIRRKQSRGMYELLRDYAGEGIQICLDGKEADPGRIASICLREGVSYMMDFIPGPADTQKISRINFTQIEGAGQEPARGLSKTVRHPSSDPDIMPGLS